MPTETDKTAAPDPRDAQIALLKSQIADLRKELDASEADNDALARSADAKIADLKEQLRVATDRPTLALSEGYAMFQGQTYKIVGDYRADNTFVPVKQGYCDEGLTLLAIDKVH